METITDVGDGSTGEIKKGYCTIEAAVLSKGKKAVADLVTMFMKHL